MSNWCDALTNVKMARTADHARPFKSRSVCLYSLSLGFQLWDDAFVMANIATYYPIYLDPSA